MRKPYLLIIVAVLVLKVFYIGQTALERKFGSEQVNTSIGLVQSTFANNDGGWYLKIAEHGYPELDGPEDLGCCDADCFHQSEYAFFPLFPRLIGFASWLTGGRVLLAGLLISTLLTCMAFITFLEFARIWLKNDRNAMISTFFLLLMPFHYFYGMIYSESLFLLLMILSFWGIMKQKWLVTSLSFALLVICRPSGLLMVLPLFLFLAEINGRRNERPWWRAMMQVSFWTQQIIWIPSALAFGIYCYCLYVQTGDPLAFKTAQAGWCKEFMLPIYSMFKTGEFFEQINSLYTSFFMVLALAMILSRRVPLSFHVLIWISILLPLTGGSVISMPRYISVIFPFFLFAAQFNWPKTAVIFCLFALFILHLTSYHYWIISPHYLGL